MRCVPGNGSVDDSGCGKGAERNDYGQSPRGGRADDPRRPRRGRRAGWCARRRWRHGSDRIAEEFIRSHDGATPSFKGLYGFPATLTSINAEVVHADIPSKKRVLDEGDILSVDVGACVGGLHGDSAAITVPVGRSRPTRTAAGGDAAAAAGIGGRGANGNVGDIGAAVQAVADAEVRRGAGAGGHGIGTQFHEEPQVPNYGQPHRGARLVAGMTIAIECMINLGGPEVRTPGRQVDRGDRRRLPFGPFRAHRPDHAERRAHPDPAAGVPDRVALAPGPLP